MHTMVCQQRDLRHPSNLIFNDETLPNFDTKEEFSDAAQGWYLSQNGFVFAKSGNLDAAKEKTFVFIFQPK